MLFGSIQESGNRITETKNFARLIATLIWIL